MSKTVAVFGASGATGKELLSCLNLRLPRSSIKKIIAVVRKNREEFEHLKNVEQWVIDFDKLEIDELYNFCGIDIGFCCIGTTLQKSSRAEFIEVERNLVLRIAKVLQRDGCEEFHLVTGFMSNSGSNFFIPRVKGESEDLVAALQFTRLFIYRPGLLRCSRSEYRPWEHLAQWLSSWMDFGNMWSISTKQLAEALVEVAETQGHDIKAVEKDCIIFEHSDIIKIWKRANGTLN